MGPLKRKGLLLNKRLAVLSLLAAPMAISQLLSINSLITYNFAAIIAMLCGILSVIMIVEHWRHS